MSANVQKSSSDSTVKWRAIRAWSDAKPSFWSTLCNAVMSLKPISHLGCSRKRVKSSFPNRCTAPYPPRLHRITLAFSSSSAFCKSSTRCLMLPPYVPCELPACLAITTSSPQDFKRFLAPFKKDLSILLEGERMMTRSPFCTYDGKIRLFIIQYFAYGDKST